MASWSYSGPGSPTCHQVLLGSNSLDTGLDDSSTTFSGAITGSGCLVKDGAGTFTLAGTDTYTGGTVVNDGTLRRLPKGHAGKCRRSPFVSCGGHPHSAAKVISSMRRRIPPPRASTHQPARPPRTEVRAARWAELRAEIAPVIPNLLVR
ncbi:MAG: autotransporter-associated beta strand repeat-containing protein [Thermoguttaceae bacterium]